MKTTTPIIVFALFYNLQDVLATDYPGIYFYKEIGCSNKNGTLRQYECPNFSDSSTCRFRTAVLKPGDTVDKELIKGSCHAECFCTSYGQIKCLTFDCRDRLKSGCSHFKYSLDTCCDDDSVCGPIAECELDGETYKEGDRMYPMSTCEKCICDEGFKKDAPFCRPRKCFDQATHHLELSKHGAPVFLGKEKCCPTTWTVDDGEKIIKMNPNLVADSELFCKFGDRSITLGYGFEKSIKFHGRNVAVKCECSIPPFIFCVEK